MRTLTAAVLSAFLLAPITYAQEPDIVVTGERLREELNAFVGEVSAPVAADNQLGRWEGALCPGVIGMPAAEAQALIDRIAMRAYQLGVETGESGCDANLLIFAATDGNAFTRGLFENDRSLFAYYYEQNISTRGHEALENFISTPRPVRWWHVVRRNEATGIQLASNNARNLPGADSGYRDAQMTPSRGTRLRQEIRQQFLRAIVVIDASQLNGAPLPAVADYVAMVSLAQIEPGADTSAHPTILNLFREGAARPTELTPWDVSYLEGVYGMTPDAASVSQQRSEIVLRMNRALQPES